ncbi:MAG: hypothetical protein M3509_12280 [Chloroflexota bacterium]|nr:hypothetical protein [Chloroflexota bacterium]
MIEAIRKLAGWPRAVALGALIAVSLAACGGEDQSEADQQSVDEAATETTAFEVDASPGALEDEASFNAPQDINVIELTIEDGRLNPSEIEAFVDEEYGLVISGDGTEHTLAIEGLVTDQTIAADGETEVALSVAGDLTEREITLDGEPAGTISVQNAAGITD